MLQIILTLSIFVILVIPMENTCITLQPDKKLCR